MIACGLGPNALLQRRCVRSKRRGDVVAWLLGVGSSVWFPLRRDEQLRIGRGHEVDAVLPGKRVSRLHAVLTVRGNRVSLEDNGSANGTRVNGRRVTHCVLRPGDRISFGDADLCVEFSWAKTTRLRRA